MFSLQIISCKQKANTTLFQAVSQSIFIHFLLETCCSAGIHNETAESKIDSQCTTYSHGQRFNKLSHVCSIWVSWTMTACLWKHGPIKSREIPTSARWKCVVIVIQSLWLYADFITPLPDKQSVIRPKAIQDELVVNLFRLCHRRYWV